MRSFGLCIIFAFSVAATHLEAQEQAGQDPEVRQGEVDGSEKPEEETQQQGYSYSDYKHRLELRAMRAGVHETDNSRYVFRVKGYGLLNSREERRKPLAERQSVVIEMGSFSDMSLQPLTSWVQEEGQEDHRLLIDGEEIRELVVATMRQMKAEERKVSVLIEVGLFLHQTKYMVWSEEVEIAKIGYFVIPYTQEVGHTQENMKLNLEEQGVKAAVELLWASDPDTPTLEED